MTELWKKIKEQSGLVDPTPKNPVSVKRSIRPEDLGHTTRVEHTPDREAVDSSYKNSDLIKLVYLVCAGLLLAVSVLLVLEALDEMNDVIEAGFSVPAWALLIFAIGSFGYMFLGAACAFLARMFWCKSELNLKKIVAFLKRLRTLGT